MNNLKSCNEYKNLVHKALEKKTWYVIHSKVSAEGHRDIYSSISVEIRKIFLGTIQKSRNAQSPNESR